MLTAPSRVLIRASLVYLVAGFGVGAVVMAGKALDWPWAWRWLPAHIELVLVGWMIQLALGVGYAILPRRAGSRGHPALTWFVPVALNVGLWLVLVGAVTGSRTATWGRGAEALAGLAFAIIAWPRVRAAGRAGR